MPDQTYNRKKIIAQLLLLALPTAVLVWYCVWNINRYYAILQNEWIEQGAAFCAGICIAIVFYSRRFRFITTTVVIILAAIAIYKQIDRIAVGEFDAFYISVQWMIYSVLFLFGWIVGYGFSRSRYFTVCWAVLLIVVQIILTSRTSQITANALITAFVPVPAYAAYIIYTAELIRNMNKQERNFIWFIAKRLVGFGTILILLIWGIFSFFQKDFLAIEKEWGKNAAPDYSKRESNTESMTKQNRDGTISSNDKSSLAGNLGGGKRLVFVAKLDNFFHDGRTPNPLYFTSYYYTKFDTLTQTFETDKSMPNNDLFKPDPSKIPLYFAKSDTAVINNTMATRSRKIVTAEVYKTILSPDEYVAPSTAFFCQPIPVEKTYKEQYKSAYRAKMWVSELNSAYFIYNPANNPQLGVFQEERFEVLRQVKDYAGIDAIFLQYYTFMPSNAEFYRVTKLSNEITKNATTPIDKVIAIRDYFLRQDEFDQPLFKYSKNPGVPGLPSANKLTYFLFDNRKGYCAYFAGATLFMLRAAGIPSRVATGFLTVDRSSKNPGWYWFYEDQAHAWVQVYFPGFGWIDFDTTIPDLNVQESPQPDQTPPLNMQQAYFVADGKVVSIDTITKKLSMTAGKILFHDKNYETNNPDTIAIDATIATVSEDSGVVRLANIKTGMHITAASYAEAIKNISPNNNDSIKGILQKMPYPVPVDEIKIIAEEVAAPAKKIISDEIENIDMLHLLWVTLIIAGALLLLLFSLPWLMWQHYNTRAKYVKPLKKQAYRKYRASMYYLNQLGYARQKTQGPEDYATYIDSIFETNMVEYNRVYQKTKYSTLALTLSEENMITQFYTPFKKQIRARIPFKSRFSKFLNIYYTLHFFTQPKINS